MKKGLLMLAFTISLLPLALASITFIEEPEGNYNLGDTLHVNFSVVKSILAMALLSCMQDIAKLMFCFTKHRKPVIVQAI